MQTGTQPAPIERKRRPVLRKRIAEMRIGLRTHRGEIAVQVLRTLCALFFPFVEWFSIPSPFGAAYLAALRPRGSAWLFPLLGACASLLLRWLWGIELDAWQYAGLALLSLLLALCKPQKERTAALLAGLCLLPRAVAPFCAGDWLSGLLALASALLAVGGTLWLRQGLAMLRHANHVLSLRDNACIVLLLAVAVAGCGYIRFGTLNLGHVVGTSLTLLLASVTGMLGGALCGLLAGCSLALSGHSCLLALCMALGGLCCGLAKSKPSPWRHCLLFLLGQGLGYFLCPGSTPPLPLAAALAGCVVYALTRPSLKERAQTLCMACLPAQHGLEDSFVQIQLERWENAMRRLTEAFPQPAALTPVEAPGTALAEALCVGCPERADCRSRHADRLGRLFDEMTGLPNADDETLSPCLQELRALGCARVHQAQGTLRRLRQNEREKRTARARARFQREMTVTHLGALAQTLRHIRQLTRGETMGDLQAAYQISKALRDARFPAQLCYARRVDGHLMAALETEGRYTGKQLQRLLLYLREEMQLPLFVSRAEKNRLELEECPLYTVAVGTAGVCAQQSPERESVSGDSVAARSAAGGRYLLLLSDGMGHGEAANRQSAKTVHLLLDCLDAGYSRTQAIAAVNGMMLLAADDDRFSTVDLFDVSLWSGEVHSEKLGACGSFLVRGDRIKRIEGASLPLGILEDITPTSQSVRMHSGDILVAVSDGVSDAFTQEGQLEAAILQSLYIQPQRMADALLRSAILASGGSPADDMTVVVLLLYDQRRSQCAPENEA